MKTWHIHIEGQVQGVGFRPFVYKCALERNIKGWVNNGCDGVHIRFNADEETAYSFHRDLVRQAPKLSRIIRHQICETGSEMFHRFEIVDSSDAAEPDLLLSPDFGLCPDCASELMAETDRRYSYPFITCTNCGPRYSIVQTLPYDRERTTMYEFKMCPECNEEYHDPLNRRHYSQTNSCSTCGIKLSFIKGGGNGKSHKEIIASIVKELKNGKIIAVKGIGGFLLMVNASDEVAIAELRRRKNRPAKPFALMYPNLETIREDVNINEWEEEILSSTESPIVLLKQKREPLNHLALKHIAPDLNELGIMLPYTPLFLMILGAFNGPVIATSGNISGSPVIYRDEDALRHLSSIADIILTNDRDIVVPQDDSVVRVANASTSIVIRRSRGFAPTHICELFDRNTPNILAMGAMLKSTFGFTHKGNCFISQYLGNLVSYETQRSYEHTLQHLTDLFKLKPEVILTDGHPEYYSTQKGYQLADHYNIPTQSIQHHEAHFMSVLAENNALEAPSKILGVIWDGTGYGSDGNIWGGEYFIFDQGEIERVDHLPYFKHILGDKMALEPRISALTLTQSLGLEVDLSSKFSTVEYSLYKRLLNNHHGLKTSSMGRVFDAVASLLGVADINSFEGEAAMHLEAEAQRFIDENSAESLEGFGDTDLRGAVKSVICGLEDQQDRGMLAANFIVWLVREIGTKAKKHGVKSIACSGGVFQNKLLVNLITQRLGEQYDLLFHKRLSPNDEGISFGQLAGYLTRKEQNENVIAEAAVFV